MIADIDAQIWNLLDWRFNCLAPSDVEDIALCCDAADQSDFIDALAQSLFEPDYTISDMWNDTDRRRYISETYSIGENEILSDDIFEQVWRILVEDVLSYYKRLRSDDDFRTNESNQRISEWRQVVERRLLQKDSARFFNRPVHTADPARWSKAAVWTMEEVAALSLGKDPKSVTLKRVAKFDDARSAFAREFRYRADLLSRAARAGELASEPSPRDALQWLKARGIDYPSAYDDLLAIDSSGRSSGSEIDAEIARLRAENSELSKLLAEPDLPPKSLASLYRMLIVMAVGKFHFRHGSSTCPTEVENLSRQISDHTHEPLVVTHDTVRSWLNTASDKLSIHINRDVWINPLTTRPPNSET